MRKKKIEDLQKRVIELEEENKSLKQTVEDILLSPGSFEYYRDGDHPMLTKEKGE